MANEEHVAVLKQGVEVWNQWRKENLDIVPDLRFTNFKKANLNYANLSGVDFREANLYGADLNWVDFTKADLRRVNLSGAYLSHANFNEAYLFEADLSQTDLYKANLSYTDLGRANLLKADITSANLSEANCIASIVGGTTLGNVDLSRAKALETVKHEGPSTIGIDTIYKSSGNIPEVFLRGSGVPDNFITFMKSLTSQAFDFYSCFISHSSKDREFVERLYADLQSNGVRCWYAPEDLKIGEPFLLGIDHGIRLHDKLLLVLSEHSVNSG